MTKVGLVLEGGAMRGLYTAGVLDVFMDNNINIDGIIGVSAGALFGVNYFSKQKERAIRYNKKYCNDKRYISFNSLLRTGNIINKDFAFYKVTHELDPFDDKEFIKTNKDFYVVVTNVKTGLPEYINLKNSVIQNLEVLRASSAMPIVSQMVEINKEKYLDGALADSVPIEKAIDIGYDKIIVILTRPLDYKKKSYSYLEKLFIKFKYRKYPKLVNVILNRYIKYNDCLDYIMDLENKKEILVIRPSQNLNISRLEKDKNKLQGVYDLGVKDAEKQIDELIKYLQ